MISGSCPNLRRLVLVRCRNRFHGNGQEKTSIESSVTSGYFEPAQAFPCMVFSEEEKCWHHGAGCSRR